MPEPTSLCKNVPKKDPPFASTARGQGGQGGSDHPRATRVQNQTPGFVSCCAGEPISSPQPPLASRFALKGGISSAQVPQSHNNKAILLLHGFLASPLIMRSLAQVFSNAGYLVKAPALPGHGSVYTDLDQVRAEDYLKCVHKEFVSLHNQPGIDEVIPVGFSIGAILALILCFEFHCPRAVLLAPAFKITRIASLFPWLSALKLDRFLPTLFCTQSEPINLGSYTRFSAYSVGQIARLIAHYNRLKRRQKTLPLVYCAANRTDATVQFEGTLQAFKDFPTGSVLRVYGTLPGDINVLQFPRIKAFSHVALPVSPKDPYFGQEGEYYGVQPQEIQWGEPTWRDKGKPIKRLTYNPDFDAMAKAILKFLNSI